MTAYLLDTGPLAAVILGRVAAEALARPWVTQGEAATSLLVYGEVVEYVASRPDHQLLRHALRALTRDVEMLDLGYDIMDRYAAVRRALRPPHGPGLIGDIDTLIAATALERDLTLVTTDGDVRRVPGLQVMLLAPRTFLPVGPSA